MLNNEYPTACRKYNHPACKYPTSLDTRGEPTQSSPYDSIIFFARNK